MRRGRVLCVELRSPELFCELVRPFTIEQLRFDGNLRRDDVLMIADMNGRSAAKIAVALDCLT
eukprot:13291776-Heterocapsa_arctica.AAC.1